MANLSRSLSLQPLSFMLCYVICSQPFAYVASRMRGGLVVMHKETIFHMFLYKREYIRCIGFRICRRSSSTSPGLAWLGWGLQFLVYSVCVISPPPPEEHGERKTKKTLALEQMNGQACLTRAHLKEMS